MPVESKITIKRKGIDRARVTRERGSSEKIRVAVTKLRFDR